jgi:hypothetical protein
MNDTPQFRQLRARASELREKGYTDRAIGGYLGLSERYVTWVLQWRDLNGKTLAQRRRELEAKRRELRRELEDER